MRALQAGIGQPACDWPAPTPLTVLQEALPHELGGLQLARAVPFPDGLALDPGITPGRPPQQKERKADHIWRAQNESSGLFWLSTLLDEPPHLDPASRFLLGSVRSKTRFHAAAIRVAARRLAARVGGFRLVARACDTDASIPQ